MTLHGPPQLKFSLSLLGCLPCWGLQIVVVWLSQFGLAVWNVMMIKILIIYLAWWWWCCSCGIKESLCRLAWCCRSAIHGALHILHGWCILRRLKYIMHRLSYFKYLLKMYKNQFNKLKYKVLKKFL